MFKILKPNGMVSTGLYQTREEAEIAVRKAGYSLWITVPAMCDNCGEKINPGEVTIQHTAPDNNKMVFYSHTKCPSFKEGCVYTYNVEYTHKETGNNYIINYHRRVPAMRKFDELQDAGHFDIAITTLIKTFG